MDPTIELMRLGQFSSQPPDSSPDSPNNNAYGSSPDSAPDAQQPAPSGDPVSGFVNGFLSGFTPQTQARDNLAGLMNKMPTYQPPGLFGRIEAGLIGATRGPQAAQQYLHQPYNDAMTGWQNQVRVGQQLASDEAQANNVGRSIAVAQQTTSDREQKMQNDMNTAQGKLGAAEQRIQIYQQNADTNKAKLDIMRETANGGTLQFDNKTDQPFMVYKDGTSKPVTGVDGVTPVLFSPQDKQEMIDSAAMARTNATQAGENSRALNKPGSNAKGVHVSRAFTAPDGTAWALMSDGSLAALKDLPIGSTNVPGAPTTTTNEQVTKDQPLGSVGALLHIPETVKSDKTTTTTKTPSGQQQTSNNKVPDASAIPLAQRVAGKTQAMVGGQLMTWNGSVWIK